MQQQRRASSHETAAPHSIGSWREVAARFSGWSLTRPFPRFVFSSDRTSEQDSARGTVSQPWFPEDARWNAERQAVEFGVEIGEYRGVVRVPRRVFQRLLPERPTPERCVEAYYLQRTRFESPLSGSCVGGS